MDNTAQVIQHERLAAPDASCEADVILDGTHFRGRWSCTLCGKTGTSAATYGVVKVALSWALAMGAAHCERH
jgi:hypothetical protein